MSISIFESVYIQLYMNSDGADFLNGYRSKQNYSGYPDPYVDLYNAAVTFLSDRHNSLSIFYSLIH